MVIDAVFVTTIAFIVSAVWAIATIRSSTAALREALEGLGREIAYLREDIRGLYGKYENLSERVAKIEGQHD